VAQGAAQQAPRPVALPVQSSSPLRAVSTANNAGIPSSLKVSDRFHDAGGKRGPSR